MDKKCILIEQEGKAPYLSFLPFQKLPYLKHGFSTRLGGVSENEFSTMNLDFRRGDDKNKVLTNFSRICDSIGIPMHSLVLTDQVHETVIRTVTKKDCGKGIFIDRDYQGVDGLITNEPYVTLTVFGADCVPLFFVDEEKHVIGVAHAGWRGTLAGIAEIMIKRFQSEFGSKPSSIQAVIGPSICRDCYEVSREVAEPMLKKYKKAAETALTQKSEEKFQLDLWEMNRQILLLAGVKEENVTVSGVCTCCQKDLLFSHRATKGKRGNLAGFLMMTE